MRKTLTVALLVLWTASTHAQQPGESATPTVSSHEQAVIELFDVMDVKQIMVGSSIAAIDSQIAGNPEIAPYRDVMIEWATRVLTWENMGPPLIKVYLETFNEAEVREMAAFYRTPAGRKALIKLPELTQKATVIGMEVAKAHQGELTEKLNARRKELEGEKKP
ncbi:MAG TPA: DUF2059 domain-containing protein [Thermoanaerobaculia bacterium]|nr:DUF2059 domain-containing protein [Thermoanaerobaculia bacterium]